jgi:hypothetical protein
MLSQQWFSGNNVTLPQMDGDNNGAVRTLDL